MRSLCIPGKHMTKIKSFSNSWQFLGPIGLTAHHMRRWTVSFSGPLGWQRITCARSREPVGAGLPGNPYPLMQRFHPRSLVAILAGTMAVVLFEQCGDVEAFLLCGCDEQKQGAQFLRVHRVEPVQIILADAGVESLHHRQVAFTDGSCGFRVWLWHGSVSNFGVMPQGATVCRFCQSCKIT